MKGIRFPQWLWNFVIIFIAVISYDSLRKLHMSGQPVLGMMVDAFGVAAIFCFLMWLLVERRP